ncbi:hypothetical protein [Dysgonomonas sp. 511]|nr:hypothetical protein [Dysgonomonas sp. 511]NDV80172.1 hypothetical protein [Dysgonomonas sp. 511]
MPDKPRDGRNEPKYLVHMLEEIAHVLDRDAEDLTDETYRTTCRFFYLED